MRWRLWQREKLQRRPPSEVDKAKLVITELERRLLVVTGGRSNGGERGSPREHS